MYENQKASKGGRRAGAPNYKAGLLLDIIEEKRPVSMEDWQVIADLYQERSRESQVRDATQIKRYFCRDSTTTVRF